LLEEKWKINCLNQNESMINEDEDVLNELLMSFKSTSTSPFYNATTTASLNYLNYKTIFLATKLSYFRLNENNINELINSLLTINPILNNELQMLFDNNIRFHSTDDNSEPDRILEICIENSIDYDFIINVLWNRIHNEPLVMKFISLRYSNYSTNIKNNLSQLNGQQQVENFDWQKDQTIYFPFFFQ
jgi:hypothetical protein